MAKNITLTFGLVTVPVAVEQSVKTTRYSSLRIIAPSGQPAQQVYRDPETGEVFEGGKNDPALRRGVKRGKAPDGSDAFAIVDPERWTTVEENQQALIKGFIPDRDLHRLPAGEAPYVERVTDRHIVRQQSGVRPRAAGILAKAMRAEKAAAVVEWRAGSKDRLGVLRVEPDGTLALLTLAYAERLRHADDDALAIAATEAPPAEVKMARELVKSLAVDASVLDEMEDGTEARKTEAIEAVLDGTEAEAPSQAPAPETASGLMAALEASIADGKRQGGRKKVTT